MDRYSPGSPIFGKGAPFTRTATLNGILDSADHFQQKKQLGESSGRPSFELPAYLVKLKNEAGAALRAGEVVELNGSPLTPLVRGNPWFKAATPNETRPFAIMLQDLPNDSNAIGTAQIAGCCMALVNLQATTDMWAYVDSGQKVLKGDRFWGDVRILVQPGGTGEQMCWVSIEKSPQSWLGKLTSQPINVGSDATVRIYEGVNVDVDTTFNITGCRNKCSTLSSTTKLVSVNRIHRKKFVSPWEC